MINFLTIIFILFNPFAFLFGQSDINAELPTLALLDVDFNFGSSLVSAVSNPNFLPIRNWNVNPPEINVKAALISIVSPVEPFEPEINEILYQKKIEDVLPIASLTKLMTGLVVLEEMNLDQIVTVSKEAVGSYGNMGSLAINEKISIKNLLYALLMESSNDAAVALAENFKETSLVDLMNKKAEELELENTHFVEPTGYNPANLSTALDLSKLVKYSLNQPIIWQIFKTVSIDLSSADGIINHHFTNTNQLLNNWPTIIGGKTGYTDEAQGCMILVIEQDLNSEYLIIIVLGAQERFLETEKLINWAKKAYIW